MMHDKIRLHFLYIAFLLTAASLVMLQILYIRASSIAFGFGFEFIFLSLVILGMGLGGIFVFFLLNNIQSSKYVSSSIIIASLVYVVSIPIPFLLVKPENNLYTFLFILAGFLSFFLGGIIASLLFRYYARKISKLYFVSLLGSALGALGIVILLELFSMPKIIISLLIFSSFSILFYALYAKPSKKLILSIITFIFAISVSALIGLDYHFQIVCPNRGTPLTIKSNAFSRVDTYLGDSETPYAYKIVADCAIVAPVVKYNAADQGHDSIEASKYFPFPTDNISSALIIGSAGGRSMVPAVKAGIENITAVEINPLVVEATEILEKSDNIYHHGSVKVFVKEGRAFVRTSKEKYDLIYLLGLRIGRIGYGAQILSENYLHTKEALDSYFEHLNENGILGLGVQKAFLPWFAETAVISLLEKGIDPTKRILLFGEDAYPTRILIFVKNSDFSKAEGDNIIKSAAEQGVDARFLSGADIEQYRNGRALTDDNPYFDFRNKGGDIYIKSLDTIMPGIAGMKNFSLASLYISLFFMIVLFSYVLAAVIPFYKLKSLRSYNILYLLGFFSAIGIGFITLELSFIHKLTLFLGHPVLSISVSLASVLFFGGLGSLATGKFKEGDIPLKIAKIIFILVLVIILFILSINFVLSKLIFLDVAYKILFAVLVLSLPSFLMGMIFPLGLKIAKRTSGKIIPWMVGIDGITSVLGGTLSFAISLMFGFNAALIFGALVYSFALLMALRMR